jgi:transcriptional regulator with XRE-family HTH domain
MNMEIGRKIKALRLQKGMTQEQLGAKLNMSSQAVSKWENNVTLPDIQLLPSLSVLMGVTIDELFALTDDSHYERIANMILNQHELTADDFTYAEQFLKDKLAQSGDATQALTLLAELHLHRSGKDRQAAARYAKEALKLAPDSKRVHNALRDAENGVILDWNYANNHKLIAYYQSFVQQEPDYWRGYVWLLNYLLADGRCAEAKDTLEQLNNIHPGYLYLLYGGLICKEEGNLEQALTLWKQMTERYADDWQAWFSRGNCMAKLCRYDEAVEYYTQAYERQPQPKYLDALIAISHIYEIQGKYDLAMVKLDEIIDHLRIEWKVTEGRAVDYYKGEKEHLLTLMDSHTKK